MSRANATVTFEDGHKMYALYCGSTDRVYSSCYKSLEIAWGMYRARCFDRCECHFRQDHFEKVIIETDYGSGHKWESLACRACMTIEGQREPYPDEDQLRKGDWP